MPFRFIQTTLEGIVQIESKVFEDQRGYFKENFKETDFREHGIDLSFVQDNHSYSRTGVIRGLHFQTEPHEQGKIVSVISGEIFDVGVDIRPASRNFRKWFGTVLSEQNARMLWIPPGFAHGFQALKDSHVYYKATSVFAASSDSGIRYDDPDIGIEWPLEIQMLSEKDKALPFLRQLSGLGGD